MDRVNRRMPRYSSAIAAVLASGLAHAAVEPGPLDTQPLLTAAVSASRVVVRDELKVADAKKFDLFIQRDPAPVNPAVSNDAARQTRPAPDLLWILGAGIIGLATVARRRSH